jgi:hypothetical protein
MPRSGTPYSGRHPFRLGRIATDQGDQSAVPAVLELRDDHAEAVAAQAHDGIAELAFRLGCAGREAGRARGQGAAGGEYEIASVQVDHLCVPISLCEEIDFNSPDDSNTKGVRRVQGAGSAIGIFCN